MGGAATGAARAGNRGVVSEQAPERPAGQAPRPAKKENVFTRKIGPLPMWVWLAIVAVLIIGYVLIFGKKKSQGTAQGGQQQRGGFGRALLPEVIIERIVPPHTRHKRHRHHGRRKHHGKPPGPPLPGGLDPGGPDVDEEAVALEAARQEAARDPGAGFHNMPGHNRRHMRGQPIPGELVQFKTAEHGATPSLQDVANHYDTDPEAIVQEAEGRGYPTGAPWKRYVARHDWAAPLPPATDFSILAHPG